MKSTRAFNAAVCEWARDNADLGFLASPVTGGGIAVDRFAQLFLLSIGAGARQPKDWADFAWSVLAAQNQRIVKDGKPLDTPEENVAELAARAATFAEKTLRCSKASRWREARVAITSVGPAPSNRLPNRRAWRPLADVDAARGRPAKRAAETTLVPRMEAWVQHPAQRIA
ncbi:hypothetical protein [Antarcticirhabdus aurantiaca]|uniref:Uncharacterized protein n=1 Tax=Antarcticirhabdus aurantiaca TaxID=2606717 RepID=A0ACD4NJ97_9HYPH|nr:hypothetical protein OXU80_18655 [Jeongeuplla avenae]